MKQFQKFSSHIYRGTTIVVLSRDHPAVGQFIARCMAVVSENVDASAGWLSALFSALLTGDLR